MQTKLFADFFLFAQTIDEMLFLIYFVPDFGFEMSESIKFKM